MSLKNIKMRGQSYQHHFTDLDEPLDDKLKAVEEGRWDDLIKSHMRLGCTIAGRYVSIGANSDEMVSAAMLGIAVDKIKKNGLDHDNITGYIVHYIHQHCSEVLRKDTVVPMPRGQKTKKTFSLRDNISSTSNASIRRGNTVSEEGNTINRGGEIVTDYSLSFKKDDFNIIEFEDILEQIIETSLEGKVIYLRRQGLTDSAIAKKLDISQSSVTRIRQSLFKRYKKCCTC